MILNHSLQSCLPNIKHLLIVWLIDDIHPENVYYYLINKLEMC